MGTVAARLRACVSALRQRQRCGKGPGRCWHVRASAVPHHDPCARLAPWGRKPGRCRAGDAQVYDTDACVGRPTSLTLAPCTTWRRQPLIYLCLSSCEAGARGGRVWERWRQWTVLCVALCFALLQQCQYVNSETLTCAAVREFRSRTGSSIRACGNQNRCDCCKLHGRCDPRANAHYTAHSQMQARSAARAITHGPPQRPNAVRRNVSALCNVCCAMLHGRDRAVQHAQAAGLAQNPSPPQRQHTPGSPWPPRSCMVLLRLHCGPSCHTQLPTAGPPRSTQLWPPS